MKDLLDPEKNLETIKNILQWVPFVVGGALVKYGGSFGLIIGLICFVFTAGYLIGKWYFKSKIKNEKVMKFISWVNVISWMLPILGYFTSSLTFSFYEQSKPKIKTKYRNLAIIGAILSILNGTIGFIL